MFNFDDKNYLNSISLGSYVVLSAKPLQNKMNSTYDHCFARCMYEFKYICNLWNLLKLLLTLLKRIEDENIVIEQTQLIDEIKWFVCFLNFCRSCKYDLPPTRIIKTIHLVSSIIYCTWMSFLYLFYFNHCHIFASLTL